jgi:hypothetical protein
MAAVCTILSEYASRSAAEFSSTFGAASRWVARSPNCWEAFFLGELDTRLEATGLFYVRYMDDVLVLAPTRWKLRRAVRELNETFAALGLDKHPDKTLIGRVAMGFDLLGYHFGPKSLMVASGRRSGLLNEWPCCASLRRARTSAFVKDQQPHRSASTGHPSPRSVRHGA